MRFLMRNEEVKKGDTIVKDVDLAHRKDQLRSYMYQDI